MLNRGLDFQKFANAVVDANGIIGVGLVTLAETFYLMTLYNKELRGIDSDTKKVKKGLMK